VTGPIASLDARYPIALLPVRIETRFVTSRVAGNTTAAGNLLVRIYPDSILADSHEPLLTAAEVGAGRAYWQRVFRDSAEHDSAERDAWTALLGTAKAERAAWIVQQTTPSNVDGHGSGAEPDFPPIDTRPANWHRAPEARGLPDRWVVSAFRDAERVYQVVSEPVRPGLALTPRLSGDADGGGVDDMVDLSGDGLTIEPALRWVYDFDEALAAGMAVTIGLTATDLAQGFSTLLVLGVRSAGSPDEQAAQLGQLLTAHRFSRGLAFIAQGTPTNNTAGGPSAYPGSDPAGAVSFQTARGSAQATAGTDGSRFAAALGLPATVVDHVAGAGRDEQTGAAAMVRALWPATVGYFLEQLLSPELSASTVDTLRQFMADWVRPRGPLPALRVGAVPYGVLPVGAHSSWSVRAGEGVPDALVDLLGRLATTAAGSTGAVARVGGSADPDADLVAVLGMDASARTVRIRRSFGYDTTWNVFGYNGRDEAGLRQRQRQVGDQILDQLGHAGRDPRALHLSYLNRAYNFGGPMVATAPLSEFDALPFDYVGWLIGAAPATLRRQEAPPVTVDALLYLMLRQALLAEYDAAARRLLDRGDLLLPHELREAELVGILPRQVVGRAAVPAVRTAWERFDMRVASISGDATIGEFLADPGSAHRDGAQELADFRDALGKLVGVPTAELDRLFTETLDACSHRVDAWLTALATRRLAGLRATPATGVYLGCYGWVLDLHADPPSPTVDVLATDGSTVPARTDSDGYVHAPSMLHAATAAVLRSAYLARSGADQRPYAVDLSSARVRAALGVLDAVRETQPLGAVLGYGFERGLHEGHPGVELDRFIDAFRRLYPAVANKAVDSGATADAVAARSVVDGLTLVHAWRAGQIPWGVSDAGLSVTDAQRAAIEAELVSLDDTIDAVSDLLLGESVYQVLKGSPGAAAATLDTLARGQRPAEPELVATPRGGTVLHQRIAVLFGDGSPAPAWAAVPGTPRAAAAPELDAWLGSLLGDPSAIACTVIRPGPVATRVSLNRLGLRPIDLFTIVQDALATGTQHELDRRVARLVPDADQPGPLTVDYDDPGAAPLSFSVACELMAAAARLIGHGRPLAATDLLPPGAGPSSAVSSAVLDGRGAAARQALTAVRDALAAAGGDASALRSALDQAAAFDIPQALSATDAAEVGRIIDLRLAAANAASTTMDVFTAVFGTGFPVVVPFQPVRPDLLGPALVAEPELGDDPDGTIEGWLAQVARIHPAVDAWRDVQLYGRAIGRDLARPRIAQLPADPGSVRWAGLGYATEADRPRSGLVSLALLGQAPPDAGVPWCGLMLADWPEIIPAVDEDAGIAVQFDAPNAQAPQAVLIAVPPDAGPTWSYAALERTLLDTVQLAKIRALDLSQLGGLGQLIPMTFLAQNTAGAAVSTSFAGLLVADATVEGLP
jgi:hypothetical protein